MFKKKNWYQGKDTNSNYELVVKYLITHYFPLEDIQHQKRYLHGGIYKTRDTRIREFICRIDNIVDYLNNTPQFGFNQGLPEDKILDFE